MNRGVKPERFGEYELVRYLAAGGMADLYLARHPDHPHQDLVVKRIQQRYLDHKRVTQMFLDEGRIAKLLEHRNIARVVDVGTVEGSDFIAMEYIHGHDLIAIMRRSQEVGVPISRAVAVGILAQIAAGLDYAHTAKDPEGMPLHIVHCDISPGNVVVSFAGVAKVVDFGIARATVALREEDGIAGKYQYMAPEQIRGELLDARADLFPLGTILWELTVGKRLFRGRPEQVMRKVLDEPIPKPSEVIADYPPELERIVMGLLGRRREDRYATAGQAAAELVEYLMRNELAFAPSNISRFLEELYDARPLALMDRADSDEIEVDRGMPQVAADSTTALEATENVRVGAFREDDVASRPAGFRLAPLAAVLVAAASLVAAWLAFH